MVPFQQGGLDSLCGVYSLVNAERLMNGSEKRRSQALFNSVVMFLKRRRILLKVLVEGMEANTMHMLLRRAAADYHVWEAVEVPWRGVASPSLDTFWRSMQDFLEGHEGRAIITCLRGMHDHWTVVRDVSGRSIWLYDSGGIERLARSECGCGKRDRPNRVHRLRPAQTYFLSKFKPEPLDNGTSRV